MDIPEFEPFLPSEFVQDHPFPIQYHDHQSLIRFSGHRELPPSETQHRRGRLLFFANRQPRCTCHSATIEIREPSSPISLSSSPQTTPLRTLFFFYLTRYLHALRLFDCWPEFTRTFTFGRRAMSRIDLYPYAIDRSVTLVIIIQLPRHA